MKLIKEPNDDAKLWTLSAIAKFIVGDGGSFRNLVYDYLGLDYDEAYRAGGMIITNAIALGKPKIGYILYSDHTGDTIFHAFFSTREEVDAYIERFIPEFRDDDCWGFVEISVNPTSRADTK